MRLTASYHRGNEAPARDALDPAVGGLRGKWIPAREERALLARIREWTPAQAITVSRAVAAFWHEPERPTGEMLREVGLVHAFRERAVEDKGPLGCSYHSKPQKHDRKSSPAS